MACVAKFAMPGKLSRNKYMSCMACVSFLHDNQLSNYLQYLNVKGNVGPYNNSYYNLHQYICNYNT